jgi:VanZ family protein
MMKLSLHCNKALDLLALILFCSFIYGLSEQSSLPTPLKFPHQDKVMHLGAYFILTFFVLRTFCHLRLSPPRLLLYSLIFSSLYGASDEWHQSFVVGRSSDVADWLADTLGAVLFLCSFQWLKFYSKSKH